MAWAETDGACSVSGGPSIHDSEAYALYLKGRHCWNQRTESALQKSVAYFHAAIDKEPDYGHAYAALAEAYTTLGLYGVLAPGDIMPRAKSAAARAIEIAPDLSTKHTAWGDRRRLRMELARGGSHYLGRAR